MILLELTTQSGAIYTVNVVNKRIRRVGKDGQASDWTDYKELIGGAVGERMEVQYETGEPTHTTPVVKLAFPSVD